MNYRKLSDTDLLNLINSSSDTGILELAESEYVRRYTNASSDRYEITGEDIDEDVMNEISKSWGSR